MAEIKSEYFANPNLFKHILPEELQSNILFNPTDAYSSYTYRLTFSMLPSNFYTDGLVNLDLKQGNRIIIAQTSVTKFQIDNLSISTVVHPSPPPTMKGHKMYNYIMHFDLKEPFGMSFIDLLNRSQFELNKTLGESDPFPLQSMPYLLEIELIGQEDKLTENDKLFGDINNAEPFYHTAIPIRIINFDVNPSPTGSEYNIQAVAIDEVVASADASVQRVPENIKIVSGDKGTVNELFESFTKQMQKLQKTQTGDIELEKPKPSIGIEKGIYMLDPLGLPGLKTIFKDMPIDKEYFDTMQNLTLTTEEDGNETIGRIEQAAEAGDEKPPNDGKKAKIKIDIKKNTPVDTVMYGLASMNHKYAKTNHRYDMDEGEAQLDTEKLNKDKTQYITPAIRREYTWQKFDDKYLYTSTGKPAMEYTYVLTGKLDSSSVIDAKELDIETSTTKGDKKKKVKLVKAAKDRNINKLYAYTYSGINDQIFDVDLKIENGIRYLVPVAGGRQTNYTQSPAAQISSAGTDKLNDFNSKVRPTTKDQILEKFEQLATDAKNLLTTLAKLPITLTEDLAAVASGLSPVGITKPNSKNIRKLNLKLPSSPVAILQKTKTIKDLTSDLDTITNRISTLQSDVEDIISNEISEQIAKITANAFTPFAVIDSAFNEISEGVSGFINEIESAVGDLGLDQYGIDTGSLLDDAKEKMSEFTKELNSITVPAGFSTGVGPGTVQNSVVENFNSIYMEEFEFDQAGYGSQNTHGENLPFGEYDPKIKTLVGPNSKFANKSIFTTALSNSQLGAPYLVQMELTIKGDPYWLGKEAPKVNNVFIHKPGNEYLGSLQTDIGKVREQSIKENIAPYGIGEVGFFFTYLFPREYDTWHDDPSRHTGEINDLSMDNSFSGTFFPYKVLHNFNGGQFRQTLQCYRTIYKGQFPKSAEEIEAEEHLEEQISASLDASKLQFDENGKLVLDSGDPLENAINNLTFTESDLATAGYVNPLSIDRLNNSDGG